MNAITLDAQKRAAAISAVFGYLRSQEDAAAMLAMSAVPAAEPQIEPDKSPVPVKLWSISARQDMMSMRNLMQMRTFQGSKQR